MAHSVDPNQTPHSAASDQGLHCLLRPVCPNTLDKYGTEFESCTRISNKQCHSRRMNYYNQFIGMIKISNEHLSHFMNFISNLHIPSCIIN